MECTKEVLRFCEMSENSDITETDFSLDDTAALYMKAAARTARVFFVLQQAIEAANANHRKPEPVAEEASGGARRKGDKGGNGAPAPAPPKTPQPAPNQQPPPAAPGRCPPTPTAHLTRTCPPAAWLAENHCSNVNCGEDGESPSRYPKHRARECPYKRRDGQPWPWNDPNRVPVTLPQDNPGLATGAETPAVAQPSHICGVDPDNGPNLPPLPDMPPPAWASGEAISSPVLVEVSMTPPASEAGEAICSPVQLDVAMPAPVTRV